MMLRELMDAHEQRLLLAALEKYCGNRTNAAGYLGISRKCLWQKMRKHNLLREDGEP